MTNEGLLALRRLTKHPSFTLPAIATLAVGVGATTAIFSALNAALLQPLPYPDAEDIYVLNVARLDGGWSNGYVSNAELTAIQSAAPSVLAAAGATGSASAGGGRRNQMGSGFMDRRAPGGGRA